MDLVLADRVHDPVAAEHVEDRGLTRARRSSAP